MSEKWLNQVISKTYHIISLHKNEFYENFQTFQVAAILITIRFTFGVRNVHLSPGPSHKLYDHTACYAQSSVYH